MRVYADSSALIKRSVAEAESDALEESLAAHVDQGDALVSSSLAWIEVSRALRGRLHDEPSAVLSDAIDDALSGISERPIAADVVSLARRIGPSLLRSLDAVHLATAVLVDADIVITYDERLAAAARYNAIVVTAPSDPGTRMSGADDVESANVDDVVDPKN